MIGLEKKKTSTACDTTLAWASVSNITTCPLWSIDICPWRRLAIVLLVNFCKMYPHGCHVAIFVHFACFQLNICAKDLKNYQYSNFSVLANSLIVWFVSNHCFLVASLVALVMNNGDLETARPIQSAFFLPIVEKPNFELYWNFSQQELMTQDSVTGIPLEPSNWFLIWAQTETKKYKSPCGELLRSILLLSSWLIPAIFDQFKALLIL